VQDATTVGPDTVLVFVHIPKTAGTLVRMVINSNEPGDRNRKPGANVFKGGGGASTKTIEKLRDEPRSLDLERVRALHGHFPLGIRDFLDSGFPERDFRYFTFLREPVDRSVSHYFEILKRGPRDDDDAPTKGLPPLAPDATFDQALEAGYLHDNLQTRMLSGLSEPFGEVTGDTLERAKRNLRDGLALVGVTEHLDESLVLAKHRFGFRSIMLPQVGRVNASRPRGRDVPQDLRDAAERHNRYDIELYSYANRLFARAPERKELEFQVDVAAYRAAKGSGATAVPDVFRGGEREWAMLIDARAALMRLEAKRGQRNARLEGKRQPPVRASGRRRLLARHRLGRRKARVRPVSGPVPGADHG
jgi:hypothetical protein